MVNDFFYSGNAVVGEPDYGLAEGYVRAAEAFANTTYQSVYIIDYYRRNFLHVSANPLFLCGMTPAEVRDKGYRFYFDHVPSDELAMLVEANRAGFNFINGVPLSEKGKYVISYDFHITNGLHKILIHHKLTGLAFQPDGSIWLGLAAVSLSQHSKPGNIKMHCRDKAECWEYNLTDHIWEKRPFHVLNDTEKAIIYLSAQGLTINSIAERVCLAVDSVKTARRRLYDKLGVKNIVEAMAYATNYKLV